jgi:hypothetical protein
MEARMGKKGKREFVQVLRLLETFQIVDVEAGVHSALEGGTIGIRVAHTSILAGLHLGPKGPPTQPEGRVERPLRRPLQRQNGRHRLQLQTYPQMARGFGSAVDRVDLEEYHRVTENGRLLTGD